jgi:Ca2+-binding RTX toxin-like protein
VFVDYDHDGDLDFIVSEGVLRYFENTGTPVAASFIERVGFVNPNPVENLLNSHGGMNQPAFGDIDGDGDDDLVVGLFNGAFAVYENTGTGLAITVNVTAEADGPTAAADTLTYGGTDDTISALGGDDVIDGGGGNDSIDGGTGHDELTGGSGDDYLKGGTGADDLFGGTGNDTYIVDDAGDTTDETGGDGTDLVRASISWTLDADLENLDLLSGGAAVNGTGNAGANTLTGNSYANTLSGLGGDDTIIGGGGNDILNGGDDADSLDGGNQNDQLNGGAGADDLVGGAGNDSLNGGTGADGMAGGLGNDNYVVDDGRDVITEAAAAGTDSVTSNLDFYSLEDNLENLTLGTAQIGNGNDLRNIITGNASGNVIDGEGENDTINGLAGADSLYGSGGNDVINGGADNDELFGGAGSDRLTGGTGADLFAFDNGDVRRSGLGQGPERDQILDLAFADGDRIDLSGIDANALTGGVDDAFAFVGKFTRTAGEAVLTYVAGRNVTTLQLDIDGDGKADFRLEINGDQRGTTGNLYTGGGDADGGWVL